MTAIAFDRTSSTSASTVQRALTAVVATDSSLLATSLRIVLALVFFPHGAQKLFGWYGGFGLDATLGYFSSLGIPMIFGVLAIAAETAGVVALIAGAGTRIAAFGLAATMSVAALVHAPFGFFMNWFGNQKGEGIEYHILAVAVAATVMVLGGGRASIDRAVAHKIAR